MNFFIVSGLSGSGKSIALQALEDLEYYCIDNLPAVLLPQFAQAFIDQKEDGLVNCAVSIDSRNKQFLHSLNQNLNNLTELGLDYKVLFLEADESTLIRRFSETRRKHPLTDQNVGLMEGINRESELLEPLSTAATRRINTSNTTAQELRGLVRDFAGGVVGNSLTLLFESFGFKHSVPRDADFVFDVRCLPNPYWEENLRNLTGLDADVREFLEHHDDVALMLNQIQEFIRTWLPQFRKQNRSYITVAIGCTGGQHRSVYISSELAKKFKAETQRVQLRHRELN